VVVGTRLSKRINNPYSKKMLSLKVTQIHLSGEWNNWISITIDNAIQAIAVSVNFRLTKPVERILGVHCTATCNNKLYLTMSSKAPSPWSLINGADWSLVRVSIIQVRLLFSSCATLLLLVVFVFVCVGVVGVACY
jgi:hypothetical protein